MAHHVHRITKMGTCVLINGNWYDPAKERACIAVANKEFPGKSVPFVIDERFLRASRAGTADTVVIALNGIAGAQLVTCRTNPVTGRFEVSGFSPERPEWQVAR